MQGIKRKRRCESQCKQHIFSLKNVKTSSKYDIKMNFCPKYQRQPLPPQQTFAQFNNDRLYYTSAFVIGIDKKTVAKNLQKEMLDHQKLVKQCCQKYNPIFPRPNNKHFVCSVCKQDYKNYYVHIFSQQHSYKVNQNSYNDSIKKLCQKFRQLWQGAQELADEEEERRRQQLQNEINNQDQGEYLEQEAENFQDQNYENKFQLAYRQYSQQKQKQIILKKSESAATSKPPKLQKQKQISKRSNTPFLYQQVPRKKVCLNDRTTSAVQQKKRKQIQYIELNQDKLEKTVPNNQEAYINARDKQEQRLKQLLADETVKTSKTQKGYINNKNQFYEKKQKEEFKYKQPSLLQGQRFKKERILIQEQQYQERRYKQKVEREKQMGYYKYNSIENNKNKFNYQNPEKNIGKVAQRQQSYQRIDLVQSQRNNLNDSNQDRIIQNDQYRSKQHHEAEDSKKSFNQISNRSRNAQLSRKMSDNFKDKNLPFQNPYYKYPSYYPPHPSYPYMNYCPPYNQFSKIDPYRRYSERQKMNTTQMQYDTRMYYPAWQPPPPPQYCMPPPVIVQSSPTSLNQNIKSQQSYSHYHPAQYSNNNFRGQQYSSHQEQNRQRQGAPNTSININFPMYMAYPPNYYQPQPRYPPSQNFNNNQQIGPLYENYHQPSFYYRSYNCQKKDYRQEKR